MLSPSEETVRSRPGTPVSEAWSPVACTATHCRVSFTLLVAVATATITEPLVTETPTPAAPTVRQPVVTVPLQVLGSMLSPTVRSDAVGTSGPGGPAVQEPPAPGSASVVPRLTATATVLSCIPKSTVPLRTPASPTVAVPDTSTRSSENVTALKAARLANAQLVISLPVCGPLL